MGLRVLLALVTLALLPGIALGQDRPQSASRHERHVDRARDSRDRFLATPETYAPRRDRTGGRSRARRGGYPLFTPWWPLAIPVTRVADDCDCDGERTPAGYVRAPQRPEALPLRAARGEAAAAEPTPLASPREPLSPPPPGEPKTFYVIPWCYAGDTPPQADRLPAGCDVSAVRVIPPR